MGRAVLIAFALAALCVNAANGLPDFSAKSRTSTASATTFHKKAQHPANHATGRVSGHKSAQASTRKHAAGRDVLRESRGRPSRTHSAAKLYPTRKSHSVAEFHPATERYAAHRQAVARAVSLRTARAATPSPLRGSYESLERQNEKTEDDNLERIEDDGDLADRIERKMLVPVPASAALIVNGNLPGNYRYCRPWTAQFLTDLARSHAAQFHRPLEVSSAVRTVAYQKRLMQTNGNATAAEGEVASPHLTGATIDIVKHGMSRQEMGWMRSRLLWLQQSGMIDVEEEFKQACFHITVYKNYEPPQPVLTGNPKQRKPAQPAQIATRGR
jgi:hypothetical protein